MRLPTTPGQRAVSLLAVGLLTAVTAACSSSTAATGGTVTFGEIFPFTGAKAELSGWGVHGVTAAIDDINRNGGSSARR